MNKKIKILLIIIITIIVGIISYCQIYPLFIKNPSNDFKPIEILDAKNEPDIDMMLSYVYNISKEKHPVGTNSNYIVMDYITSCLDNMNVEYDIQRIDLDETFFIKNGNRTKEELERKKNDYYIQLQNKSKNNNVDELVRKELGYNSFDEFYSKEILNGESIDSLVQKKINEDIIKYKNQSLNNIIVKLGASNDKTAKNIVLVAHYDSEENSYGAGDDGICVSSLLETIRCNNCNNFMNNIYVVFTDGEEKNYWGAYELIENIDINPDLLINFDNSGNSGKLVLYHYSNSNIAKQYFEAVANECSYSFSNDILYNKNSNFYQGDCSDAFVFVEKKYATLDFAITGNPYYYHSSKDNFYNIDVNTLNNMTKSMMTIVQYYSNNKIELEKDSNNLHFNIMNGVMISINKTIYTVISIVLICIVFIYIIIMFKKHDKLWKKILSVLCLTGAILTLSIFKYFSCIASVPIIIMIIVEFIKNKKIKELTSLILLEFYLFVVLQPIMMLSQFIIWSLCR